MQNISALAFKTVDNIKLAYRTVDEFVPNNYAKLGLILGTGFCGYIGFKMYENIISKRIS